MPTRPDQQRDAGPIRDLLFGDQHMSRWPLQDNVDGEGPFSVFIRARQRFNSSNFPEAVALWRSITTARGLESRHYLQAWHFLRQHGRQPPPELAKCVYGVVVEVGMPGGPDTLAAYADLSARYFNHSGASVIWEHPDDSLNLKIAILLGHAERIVKQIGPWDKDRPPPPGPDQLRLNMLTPSGLHFGQGPISVLAEDPFSAPLFAAATDLLQALTAKSPPH